MKDLLILLACLFSSVVLLAQIPQAFNYQAAVRNSAGEIQINIPANFEIEILQNGSSIYTEQHVGLNTGLTGVVNFKVGQGTEPSSDFSQVDWSAGGLQIRVKLNGEEMGVSDIVAVPFALYAQSAGNNHWIKTDTTLYYLGADVGIGTSTPSDPLEVIGTIRVTGTGNHRKLRLYATTSTDDNQILSYDENNDRMWTIVMGDRDHNNNFVIDHPLYGGHEFVVDSSGYVGIGINEPISPLHIHDTGTGSSNGLRLTKDNNPFEIRLHLAGNINSDPDDKYGLLNLGGGTILRGNEKLSEFGGMVEVKCLSIVGGCDIKEDLNSVEKLEPGDIVVIDEKKPGNIRRTNEEYDRKVAGIISGANGIDPGISLSQDDILEGEYPLTMLGRVYVKVTGKVEIGDMLTTSSKFGYAMSVKDYSKAHGTVIGKAMTNNEKGDGMVLVLVNLQ